MKILAEVRHWVKSSEKNSQSIDNKVIYIWDRGDEYRACGCRAIHLVGLGDLR